MNENEFHYEENLEAGHLKSFLDKNNVKADLIYINTDRNFDYQSIVSPEISLFAFALTESNVNNVFTTIKIIKKYNPQVTVCVFDSFATYNWENILKDNPQIDFIPYGSAYKTIFNVYMKIKCGHLLTSIDSENLLTQNTSLTSEKHFAKSDFTDYIWADRENLNSRNVIIAHIISAYGCSSRCSFCTMPQMDNSISFRDINDVLNEIININTQYNIRFFHFNDPSFEGGGRFGKERMAHLCELLISYPKKFGFRCFIRAGSFSTTEDEKYLILLKKAGFRNLFVGIESGSDFDLSLYNKRSTVYNNEVFMNICKKNGIEPFYGFVMLHPYSTSETIKDNFKFLVKYSSSQLSHYINCLQIYSNTPIFKKITQDGLLNYDYDYKKNPFQYRCSISHIDDIKKFFEQDFYSDLELQRKNSAYHNFIFLKNYLQSIGITDEKINEKASAISNRLAIMFNEYFSNLYFDQNIEWCKNKANEFIEQLKIIYYSLEPMKEKLLKLYYKSMF